MARATLVVKPGEEPAIGIFAEADAAQEARIAVQAHDAAGAVGRLRYVSYAAAERHAARLADELVRRFGESAVRGFRYAAIPRGGHLVLGVLAALLDLPPARLAGEGEPGAPLVAVDDCALSGARFGAFLAGCAAERVIFAHLASHPELRAAIAAREPRVLACLAAFDLADHGPGQAGYAAARARWAERLGAGRYWVGDPDLVCFPWNEPDRLVWVPATERIESGWKLLPPQRAYYTYEGSLTQPPCTEGVRWILMREPLMRRENVSMRVHIVPVTPNRSRSAVFRKTPSPRMIAATSPFATSLKVSGRRISFDCASAMGVSRMTTAAMANASR